MPTRAQAAAGLPPQHAGPRMRGMTLIELMVVVAIVAILSTLAVASYRRYVLRANRTDATSALLRIQVAEDVYDRSERGRSQRRHPHSERLL